MGALLALLLLEATEEIVMLVLLATVAALGPQLGVQLGENPRFSLAATAAAAAGAWTCIWGLKGCDWWTASDPQAVAKAVLSKPLFSCATRFDVVIGELKFVGEGPKTDPVFIIGEGSTTAGCVANGDEPKMEAPVDWPVIMKYR